MKVYDPEYRLARHPQYYYTLADGFYLLYDPQDKFQGYFYTLDEVYAFIEKGAKNER